MNASPQVPLVVVLTTVNVFVPQVSFAVSSSNVHSTVHCTILLLAQVITGGVVSTTVTVWLHCDRLPQASVARQVHVAMNAFPHVEFVTVSSISIRFVPQVSVAVGVLKVHDAVHCTVLLL